MRSAIVEGRSHRFYEKAEIPAQPNHFQCLTVSGEGHGAGFNAVPRYQGSSERRRFALTWVLTRTQSWSRRHGIEGFRVAYFCTLLGCGVLFGAFVGGYKGFVDAVTPAVDLPYSVEQLATSDAGWTAMLRQYRASRCPSDSVAENARESRWRRLIERVAADSGSGALSGASSGGEGGGYFVRHVASAGNGMQKMVVTP